MKPSIDAKDLSSTYAIGENIAQEVLDTCRGSKRSAALVIAGAAVLNIGPREAAQAFSFAVRRLDSETDPEIIRDPSILPAVVSLSVRAAELLQNGGPPTETNLEVCRRAMRETGIALTIRLKQLIAPK